MKNKVKRKIVNRQARTIFGLTKDESQINFNRYNIEKKRVVKNIEDMTFMNYWVV